MENIPNDVVLIVLSFLDLQNLFNVARVCSKWKNLVYYNVYPPGEQIRTEEYELNTNWYLGGYVLNLWNQNQRRQIASHCFKLGSKHVGGLKPPISKYIIAIRCFSMAIKLNDTTPEKLETYTARANIYKSLRIYDKCLQDHNILVQLNPIPEQYHKRAVVYDESGRSELAVQDYTTCIGLEPAVEVWYNNRGCSYDDMQEFDKALLDYARAIEINPDYTDAFNNRGFSYNRIGRYQDAIKECNKAIGTHPNYANAHCHKAEAHFRLDEIEEALNCTQIAIELDPSYPRTYYLRGCIFMKMMDYSEAISLFQQFLDMKPIRTYPVKDAELNLASCQRKLKEQFE